MSITLKSTDLRLINMRTRLPFRYGIATLTALPHLLAEGTFEIDGKTITGASADHLPPKWFTKNPTESYRDELAAMFHVIESAFDFAEQVGPQATVFDLWQRVYVEQMQWASGEGYPPLLWNFGVSLVERAAIDAHCRAGGLTFAHAVRQNTLGINLCEMHSELGDAQPRDLLPAEPRTSIEIRHTVGLGDPLTADDIAPDSALDDGLPQSLDQCIEAYGLSRFKIKLAGDAEADRSRLIRIAGILADGCGDDYRFTLDGNENWSDPQTFCDFWKDVNGDTSLAPFLAKLIAVEQPIHRDVALDASTAEVLLGWEDGPPLIIDESDGVLGSCELALDCGYVGTSHKNCKGVFKGIANAALIEFRRRTDEDGSYLMTGEDLSNVAPIALMEDLAVLATLGITHAERNSQHYFRGLTYLPDDLPDAVLAQHTDMYQRRDDGLITAAIHDGKMQIDSVVKAPFGGHLHFDRSRFSTLDDWTYGSLGITGDSD